MEGAMPKTSALDKGRLSPAAVVLAIVENIFDELTMDIHEKLAELRELCVERVSFDLPNRRLRLFPC